MTALVADASAIVDLLVGGPRAAAIRSALARVPEIHVPEHFHVEALSALRGIHRRQERDAEAVLRAIDLLLELRVVRHPVAALAREVWALRDTLTAYDGAYLALARQLSAPLLTTDRGLAAAARSDGRAVDLED